MVEMEVDEEDREMELQGEMRIACGACTGQSWLILFSMGCTHWNINIRQIGQIKITQDDTIISLRVVVPYQHFYTLNIFVIV